MFGWQGLIGRYVFGNYNRPYCSGFRNFRHIVMITEAKKYCLLGLFPFLLIGFSAFAQPTNPTLVAPNDNHLFTDNNFSFAWNAYTGAINYTIEISADSLFATSDISQSGLIVTTFSTTALLGNTEYFWRVQASTGGGPTLWSAVRSFYKFSPPDISNLELWLRADVGVDTSITGNVTQWNDQSGNNRHAIQPNSNWQPVYHLRGVNGFSAIHFNGAIDTHYLDIASSGAMLGSAFVLANWQMGATIFPNFNGLLTRQVAGANSILFIGHGGSTNMYDGVGFTTPHISASGFD